MWNLILAAAECSAAIILLSASIQAEIVSRNLAHLSVSDLFTHIALIVACMVALAFSGPTLFLTTSLAATSLIGGSLPGWDLGLPTTIETIWGVINFIFVACWGLWMAMGLMIVWGNSPASEDRLGTKENLEGASMQRRNRYDLRRWSKAVFWQRFPYGMEFGRLLPRIRIAVVVIASGISGYLYGDVFPLIHEAKRVVQAEWSEATARLHTKGLITRITGSYPDRWELDRYYEERLKAEGSNDPIAAQSEGREGSPHVSPPGADLHYWVETGMGREIWSLRPDIEGEADEVVRLRSMSEETRSLHDTDDLIVKILAKRAGQGLRLRVGEHVALLEENGRCILIRKPESNGPWAGTAVHDRITYYKVKIVSARRPASRSELSGPPVIRFLRLASPQQLVSYKGKWMTIRDALALHLKDESIPGGPRARWSDFWANHSH